MEETEEVRYLTDYSAGDIVLWNGSWKVVIPQDKYSIDVYPTKDYTPIGVVVIPASHMYDNKARMMSTRWMSCDDPENGSLTHTRMLWGTDDDIRGLTNYMQVPVIAKYDDENHGGITALTEPQAIYTAQAYAFLPSNYSGYTGNTNPEDEGTRWFTNQTRYTSSGQFEAYNRYAPSPYAKDGTPNPLYRATYYSGGTINNALSYFDGRHQTDVILETRGERDYSSWKPTSGIAEDFPAASCCDMYHTVGTNQGDWYLPSQAELGYVLPRLSDIINSLNAVNGINLFYEGEETHRYWFWSSTETDNLNVRHMNYGYGNAYGQISKRDNGDAVAFTTI